MRQLISFLSCLVALSTFGVPQLWAHDEVLIASHYSRPVYFDGTFLFKLKLLPDDTSGEWRWANLEILRLKNGATGDDDRDWKPAGNRTLTISSHRQYLPTSPRNWSPYTLYVQRKSDGSEKLSFLIFNSGDRYMAFRHGLFDRANMTLTGELREGNNPDNPNDIGVYRSTAIQFDLLH